MKLNNKTKEVKSPEKKIPKKRTKIIMITWGLRNVSMKKKQKKHRVRRKIV